MQLPEITNEDLKQYCGFNYDFIAENQSLLTLMKGWATDIIWNLIKMNYDPTSDLHILAVRKAICSQIYYWTETNTSPVNESALSSYSLGEMSGSFDVSNPSGHTSGAQLCSLARMHLNNAYLLYRGMRHGRA